DDTLIGTLKADTISTGSGNDLVSAHPGDDVITIDGMGNKVIDGGDGWDRFIVDIPGVNSLKDFGGYETDRDIKLIHNNGDIIEFGANDPDALDVQTSTIFTIGNNDYAYNFLSFLGITERTLYVGTADPDAGSDTVNINIGDKYLPEEFNLWDYYREGPITILGQNNTDGSLKIDFRGSGGPAIVERSFPHGVTIDFSHSTGDDYILGFALINEDSIDLGAGNDKFEMETRNYDLSNINVSKLDGGDGIDTLVYGRGHGLSEITLSSLNAVNFEHLIGSSYDDEILRGDDDNNEIASYGGTDTIYGYGGDDTLRGDESYSTIYGGSGDDYLYGGLVDGGLGQDRLRGERIVLREGDGSTSLERANIIETFAKGDNLFILDGGLSFSDLTIAQHEYDENFPMGSSFSWSVQVKSTGEYLARVRDDWGIANTIGEEDFVEVSSLPESGMVAIVDQDYQSGSSETLAVSDFTSNQDEHDILSPSEGII
ncbi:hypothetical protein N9E48_11210, partial [Paracoccaceae bacterium]|nr:hypothetical protein [Paracoccaceae bacterium]